MAVVAFLHNPIGLGVWLPVHVARTPVRPKIGVLFSAFAESVAQVFARDPPCYPSRVSHARGTPRNTLSDGPSQGFIP